MSNPKHKEMRRRDIENIFLYLKTHLGSIFTREEMRRGVVLLAG
jgi:serine/threonine-protein kinase RIO1